MADLAWLKGFQFSDDSGNPLNAGTLNIYDAGTLSARTVYQDDGAATPWTQPITLNSAGRLTASVYVPTGDWKFILKNSLAVTIATEDNIPGATPVTSTDFANPERPIVTKAANYTVTVADIGSLFVADSTGGSVTLSLPAAGLVANGRGISVLHYGTANSVILDGNGAETINGSATLTLANKPTYVDIVSDGVSSWYATSPFAGGQLFGSLDWAAAVSIASAASVDLGAQTSNLVNITGSTGPITSFGTAAAGKFRWVKFASTPTITHNATSMILPGGVDITAVAGDTALFVSEGSGNWRGYFYSPLPALATRAGLIEIATNAEAQALADTARAVTPANLASLVATQADQETGTAVDRFVSPGRQHFHPGHSKCWAYVTVSAGTPTLQTSYNITSIADTATGRLTITIATDFSTANWASAATVERANTSANSADNRIVTTRTGGKAAGTIELDCWMADAPPTLADPAAWSMVGFGDQA